MSTDFNDMAFWFPPLEPAGLPVPRTELVQTDVALYDLLDGKDPSGWALFLDALTGAAERVGAPFFLRTGHTSGKHDWVRTCYVSEAHRDVLAYHVAALVEQSAMGIPGLPTDTWAVRELIPTIPICHCDAYGGMPVVREFRLFVRDGRVEHDQPYWPIAAVAAGRPDVADWKDQLAEISEISGVEISMLQSWALDAARAVGGGYWSVDFLQATDESWWLTDMAQGDVSFRYDPEERA